MAIPTYTKSPDAVLDFGIDWTDSLDGDTISGSTWSFPTGLTAGSQWFTASAAMTYISGGTTGNSYLLVNTITTAGDRTLDRAIRIEVDAPTSSIGSASYSGDPSRSQRDAIRFHLGDTDITDFMASDGELDYALATRGTVYGAVALTARALAAKYARLVSSSGDGASVQHSAKHQQFLQIAREYEARSALPAKPYAGGMSLADMAARSSDTDRPPNLFDLGMNDNPATNPVFIRVPATAGALIDTSTWPLV